MNLNSFFNKKPKIEVVAETKEVIKSNLLERLGSSRYVHLIPIVSILLSGGVAQVYYRGKNAENTEKEERFRRTALEQEYSDINLSHMDVDSIKAIMDEVEVMMAGDDGNQFEMLKKALERDTVLNQEFFKLFQDKEVRSRLNYLGQYFMFYEPMFYRLTRDSATLAKIHNPIVDSFIEKAHLEPKKGKKNFVFNVYEVLNLDPKESNIIFDPVYLQGIARAEECDIVSNHFPNAETFQVLGSDEKIYDFIKKLHSSFDIVVPSYFIQEASTARQGLEEKTSLPDEPIQEDYTGIDLEKNKNVLEFARGTSLSESELVVLMYDKELHFNALFSNPDFKESFQVLRSLGVPLHQILWAPTNKLDIIKSKPFLNMLQTIDLETDPRPGLNLSFKDFFLPMSDITQQGKDTTLILEKYRLSTEEGCKEFLEKMEYVNSIMPLADIYTKLSVLGDVDILRNIYENLNHASYSENENPLEFLNDPALAYLVKLGYHKKVPPLFELVSKRTQTEWLMRTVRNMYLSNTEPTEENFMKFFKEMLDMRINPEFTKLSLFSGRDVVCLAHNEIWESKNTDRFLAQSLQVAISDQKPRDVMFLRGGQDLESLVVAKKEFLNYIKEHNNLTTFMDGHGGPENFFLSSGALGPDGKPVNQGSVNISYKELADAFWEREQRGFSGQSIIILSSCFNQNFIRSFYEALEKKGITNLPVCIGESEYGQFGFSNKTVKYGSEFMREIFRDKQGKSISVQDIIDIEDRNQKERMLDSNPSIFFPVQIENKGGKKDIHWQIAEQKYLDHPDDRARSNPFQA